VVLLMVPGAVLMPWRDEAAAIATLFYGGQETSHAFASLVFGDSNPAGKLPIMIPKSEADTIQPTGARQVSYSEQLNTSYRNRHLQAAYPFGFGLSYTTFRVSLSDTSVAKELWQMHLLPSPDPPGRPGIKRASAYLVHATVKVENTGQRPGKEVVQAYLTFPDAAETPALQLRGFRKTQELQPGEHEVLNFYFSPRDFALYLPSQHWQVQEHVILRMGTSSEDLQDEVQLSPTWVAHTVQRTTTSTTDMSVPSLVQDGRLALPSVKSPAELQPTVSPTNANTWILWLLQPLLLLFVVGLAVCATRGSPKRGLSCLPAKQNP